MIALMRDLVVKLQADKKFKHVSRPGETPADPNIPTVLLSGTVTKFQSGSRAKRYE
jgi:hypothetical protein